jgi:hypothetical protein
VFVSVFFGCYFSVFLPLLKNLLYLHVISGHYFFLKIVLIFLKEICFNCLFLSLLMGFFYFFCDVYFFYVFCLHFLFFWFLFSLLMVCLVFEVIVQGL